MKNIINKAHYGLSLDLIKKLPDNSIHSVITSPPYWQLRDYGYPEQWGLEPTFEEYLEHLWSLMDEIWTVLRDDGTVWINLSDTYARGARSKDGVNNTIQSASKENHIEPSSKPNYKSLNKTLLMIPHRFAIGCLDRGWKVRNDIIWAIRNRKPESVKDRFSRKKEYIFLLTKQDKYYFDLDAVKDPLKTESIQRYMRGMSKKNKYADHDSTQTLNKPKKRITNQKERKAFEEKMKNAGKNPGDVVSFWEEYKDVNIFDYLSEAYDYFVNGDVWDITNKGTKYKHFACVDSETECLTISGWKKYSELLKDDLIASYDHSTKSMHYKPIRNIHIYNVVDENLLEISSNTLSMLVTKNHRQLVYNKKTNKTLYKEFHEINQYDKFATFEKWSSFSIPDNSPIELWELMGWISSDGHYTQRSIHITQSYTVNKSKCKRIEFLLDSLNFDYKIHKIKRIIKNKKYLYYDFSFKLKDSYQIFNHMPNKKPQWYFSLLSIDKIKAFVDGFIGGDGSIRKDDKRISISQKDKNVMDILQIMVNKLGYRSILSKKKNEDNYLMSLTKNKYVTARNTEGKGLKIKEKKYTGIVWCPETVDGNFLMRKDGKIVITGNSYPTQLLEKPIKAGSPEGGIILDPFCGISTTGIMAIENNRKFIGFDGSKEYVDVSNERLREVKQKIKQRLF